MPVTLWPDWRPCPSLNMSEHGQIEPIRLAALIWRSRKCLKTLGSLCSKWLELDRTRSARNSGKRQCHIRIYIANASFGTKNWLFNEVRLWSEAISRSDGHLIALEWKLFWAPEWEPLKKCAIWKVSKKLFRPKILGVQNVFQKAHSL